MVSDEEIGAACAMLKKAVYEHRRELLDEWTSAVTWQEKLIELELKLCGQSTALPYDGES